MILLIHKSEAVVKIIDLETNQSINNSAKRVTNALFEIAEKYDDRIIVWCHKSQKENINLEGLKAAFYLKNMMLSYSKNQYLPLQIGYVEDSPFLKVNKRVKYPTWLMSSNIGAIHASQLLKVKNQIDLKQPLDFVLNSIAKLGMPNGLFCYSEPRLLIGDYVELNTKQASFQQLFKFIKQHYKSIWCVLLFVNSVVHDKKIPLMAFVRSLFVKKINFSSQIVLQNLNEQKNNEAQTVDVIIPTLGRKDYLYDVLLDLEKQTLLPKQVLIVEQNEDKTSKSELDFINTKTWPFKIIHEFTHQTGACNARNIALKTVNSNYVFLADDDISIQTNFLEDSVCKMKQYKLKAITLSCLQSKDTKVYSVVKQWVTFGSGCSIVQSNCLKGVDFDMTYEFSFGEDADFGMQLRNKGVDVIYFPEPEIEHLKAPIGGFRTVFKNKWTLKGDTPKPSPTITFYKLKHQTKEQLRGYKLVLFFKFYKDQSIKNTFRYYKVFKKQWQQSIYWANQIKSN